MSAVLNNWEQSFRRHHSQPLATWNSEAFVHQAGCSSRVLHPFLLERRQIHTTPSAMSAALRGHVYPFVQNIAFTPKAVGGTHLSTL
jgi:hypothetical protein